MNERRPEVSLEEILDEFLARQRCGEGPGVEEYVARFPHLAEDLRGTLPALRSELHHHGQGGAFSSGAPAKGATRDRGLPDQIGDYRILGEIGRGGMGVVYEAEQLPLGRRVALKALTRPASKDDSSLIRFRREARAAARLHHTNIVPVFEVGQEGDCTFYTMQLIRGQGLDAVIDDLKRLRADAGADRRETEGSLPAGLARSLLTGDFRVEDLHATPDAPPEGEGFPPDAAAEGSAPDGERCVPRSSAVLSGPPDGSAIDSDHRRYYRSVAQVGLQAAEALSYAHARGVVHRDIKPSNLLLDTAGVVWLTDFGLAKTDEEAISHSGDILGTIRYMSPERFRGECDARADVYSLGLTLYELLLLRPAFRSPDRLRLVRLITHAEPMRPRAADRGIPRDLETIILKAVDKDPRRRYQSADDLAADLRRFLDGDPIHARPISSVERLLKWARRYPAAAALHLLVPLVLLLASLGGGATWLWTRAETAQRAAERDRQSAEDAEAQAKRAGGEAERQRHLAEKASYVSRVMRAHFEWLDNGTARADQLLNECPTELRDWEWHYVRGLCHTDLFTLGGAGQPLTCVAVSPDGKYVAAGGKDGGVFVWEAAPGRPCRAFAGHGARVWSVHFSPDGDRFVSAGSDQVAAVWDARTGQRLHTLKGHRGLVRSVRYSPDGRCIATAGYDGTVKLWGAETGGLTRTLTGGNHRMESVGFDPGGERIAAGDSDRGTLRVWDARTGELIHTTHTLSAPASLCYSPDGRWLASTSYDGVVKLWETERWGLVRSWRLGHPAECVCFTPDGRGVAAAGGSPTLGVVTVWDARTGREVLSLKGHPAQVMCLSYSADGRRIATGSIDQTVRLWDAESGSAILGPLAGHSSYVSQVCFSPDGRRLVSGGWDGTIRLWDAHGGEEVLVLKGRRDRISSLCIGPGGRQLAGAEQQSGTVRILTAPGYAPGR